MICVSDREQSLLQAFRSMDENSQYDALCMVVSIAQDQPRRPAPALRLVASSARALRKEATDVRCAN
jgi:hypothetical protein